MNTGIKTFNNARFKLTAWYLLIIMALSMLFSLVVYKALTAEVDRFERAQRFFIERRINEGNFPPPPSEGRRVLFTAGEPINPELVAETKQRILLMLVAANAGILVITGGLGYLLAGKTLRPIKEMVDDQNRFITDASHELKTPLTALRSEFELAVIDEDKLQLKDSKYLIKSGLEEIINLQTLAENLLVLTGQNNKISQNLEEDLSLLQIVETAFKKVVPLAKKKHIVIENEIDDSNLKGDMQSLTELFVILLDNAIKYSPNSSKIMLVSKIIDNKVQIDIKDRGVGIDKKDLPHIFNRFYRADKSRSKSHGYGLGLAIAKQIIDIHGGSIYAVSNSRTGTTFTVKLPV